jgi:hypothetical protein
MGDTMRPHHPDAFNYPVIVGRNDSAFSGGQGFSSIETEHAKIVFSSDAPSLVKRRESMGGILNNLKSI